MIITVKGHRLGRPSIRTELHSRTHTYTTALPACPVLLLRQEILPYAEKAYGVSSDPALRAFGGSSFGGICALCCAVRHPGVFGGLLVESPSLWFGEERMLREELPAYGGPWPQRVYLAMGTEVRRVNEILVH